MTLEKGNIPDPIEKKQQKNKVETPEQKIGKEYKKITSRYEKEYTKLNNKDQKKGVWIQYNKEGSLFTKGKYGSELFIKEVQNHKDKNEKNDIYTETGLHYDGKNFYLVMYHGTGGGDTLKTTEQIGEWAKPKKISYEQAQLILNKIKQYEKEDKEITTNKIKKSIAQVEQQDKDAADDLLKSLDEQVA